MPASTATFSPPESVTIPGVIALEALALLNAYADLMADFRVDGQADPFFTIEDPVWRSLMAALGQDMEEDLTTPLCVAMDERSSRLAEDIRSRFDGPALGAIAMTKMAHDISEVKARLEYASAPRVRRAAA